MLRTARAGARLAALAAAWTACAYDTLQPASGFVVPRDVSAWIARRNHCDSWLQMHAYDDASDALRAKRVREYCAGSDVEQAELIAKYARDGRVLDMLSYYEPLGPGVVPE